MAQPKNRVLARKGARSITQAELEKVIGTGSVHTNFILLTNQSTNMGRDTTIDEITQ